MAGPDVDSGALVRRGSDLTQVSLSGFSLGWQLIAIPAFINLPDLTWLQLGL